MTKKKSTTKRARPAATAAAQPPKPKLVLVDRPRVVTCSEAGYRDVLWRISDGQLQAKDSLDTGVWTCVESRLPDSVAARDAAFRPDGVLVRPYRFTPSRIRLLYDLLQHPTEKVWVIAEDANHA